MCQVNEREAGSRLDPKWDASGLVTAVATDAATGSLLMLAHMNAEALERTIASGEAHFWSRSRGRLWKKGEESGNVLKVREMHLAGATVLRGPVGFGASSRLHTTKILRLSEDLPLVIEIVDSEEKIDDFLPLLDGMMSSGLITLEKVQVLQYGLNKPV